MRTGTKLVYIDSGVLIDAAIGKGIAALYAIKVLDDPKLLFASSLFVKLEVLPTAQYNKNKEESEFYLDFFSNKVTHWASVSDRLIHSAFHEAVAVGLSAMDALHIVSAASVNADEFITTEKSTKPMHRTSLVTVRTIHP